MRGGVVISRKANLVLDNSTSHSSPTFFGQFKWKATESCAKDVTKLLQANQKLCPSGKDTTHSTVKSWLFLIMVNIIQNYPECNGRPKYWNSWILQSNVDLYTCVSEKQMYPITIYDLHVSVWIKKFEPMPITGLHCLYYNACT